MYTYSIATDTANGKLDEDSLVLEISQSSITIALDTMAVIADEIQITFKAALSAAEETALDAVIAAHQGVSIEPEPPIVQLSTKTPEGLNEIAITKPDGNAKTYISHNFCDSSTWNAHDDSTWCLVAPAGKLFKVLKAEVQFSHDVQMGSHVPPRQMKLDVMAGGAPVPDESKVFNSITDVFDLGNKHYSMDATVDGVGGMTTVVFDYANVILLRSSWGMSMNFYTADHTELGGSHCSVSLVAEMVDE